MTVPFFNSEVEARKKVVELFKKWVWRPEQYALRREFIERVEKNEIETVACFCDVNTVCHGDVWIDVWNEYKKGEA